MPTPGPRVLVVSRWGARCGVSTYTEQLVVEGLQPAGCTVAVASEMSTAVHQRAGLAGVPVLDRAWMQGGIGIRDVIEPYLAQVDVVHVQHEHGIFPHGSQFLAQIAQINKVRPVVLTLHTVYEAQSEFSVFYERLRSCVSGVIVHSSTAAAALMAPGRAACVVGCIPHGTPIRQGNREQGRKLLEVPLDAVLGVSLGFQGYGKNVHATLRALAQAYAAYQLGSNVRYAVIGEFQDGFNADLNRYIEWLGLGDRVLFRDGFMSEAKVQHILAAADFEVLNTTGWTLSSSGQVHQAVGAGVPLAVADHPIYYDGIRAGAVVFKVDQDKATPSLVHAIGTLASSGALREQISAQHRIYAELTSWARVGQLHKQFYERVVAGYGANRG